MSASVVIDDADDPRLTDFAGLRYPERRMQLEADGGFYVGEGTLVVERMITLGAAIRAVATTPAVHARHADLLDAVAAPVYVLERTVLNALVGFDLHRGIVASAARPTIPDAADVLADATVRTVLALEGLNDFENLGSIMRSAAALGADAVLLCPRCADPFYRRCVRVSMGHVLALRIGRLPAWPAAGDVLRAAGMTTFALTPGGDVDLQRAFGSAERVALLLGAEGPGLSDAALVTADHRVAIRMANDVDSLNVAVTAAIALHAAVPQ